MRQIIFALLSLWLSMSYNLQAQSGCTDPQAINFDPTAVLNDGTCQYAQTSITPVFVSQVDHELNEISGMTYAGHAWWSHNDSGNAMQCYDFDPVNGMILRTITLSGASNIDWEDIGSDSENLFIGDFGNNQNDRQDLGIYQAPLSALDSGSQQMIDSSQYHFIPFAYPDQTQFATIPQDSAMFDCEAMLYFQGKLHLFTKNHRDYTTTHYALDLQSHQVEKLETWNTGGMITGADISPDGKLIALTGYNLHGLPTVFCWLLWDWQPGSDLFFSGNKRRIELGSALVAGQVESIGFMENRKAYIANEITSYLGIVFVEPSTWLVDFSNFVPDENASVSDLHSIEGFQVVPNPANSDIRLMWPPQSSRPDLLQVFDGQGVIIYSSPEISAPVNLLPYPAGCYYIRAVWANGHCVIRPVIKA